jgi:hypothetical protein
VRLENDRFKIELVMVASGKRVQGKGRIYRTSGATAVLLGWRPRTIDIDVKPEPEPAGLFNQQPENRPGSLFCNRHER